MNRLQEEKKIRKFVGGTTANTTPRAYMDILLSTFMGKK
jgi:hypothetical protein